MEHPQTSPVDSPPRKHKGPLSAWWISKRKWPSSSVSPFGKPICPSSKFQSLSFWWIITTYISQQKSHVEPWFSHLLYSRKIHLPFQAPCLASNRQVFGERNFKSRSETSKTNHPKNPWTLQWRGLNLYDAGVRVLKIATFEGSGFLGQLPIRLCYISLAIPWPPNLDVPEIKGLSMLRWSPVPPCKTRKVWPCLRRLYSSMTSDAVTSCVHPDEWERSRCNPKKSNILGKIHMEHHAIYVDFWDWAPAWAETTWGECVDRLWSGAVNYKNIQECSWCSTQLCLRCDVLMFFPAKFLNCLFFQNHAKDFIIVSTTTNNNNNNNNNNQWHQVDPALRRDETIPPGPNVSASVYKLVHLETNLAPIAWLTLPETNSKSTWKWMIGIRSFPFGIV